MFAGDTSGDNQIIGLFPILRLTPPLLAVGLAIAWREVNFALILAVMTGALLVSDGVPGTAIDVFSETLVSQIADNDHASVILFTVMLGAMISVMNRSGGTTAAVQQITRFADTREKTMGMTWLSGLVVFFDDYANTMLIGGAMRPLYERMKLSRAKLAFIIDSTAAPVAGLAISTWTAFEIDQVQAGLNAIGSTGNAGSVFFATIPFRFYPLAMIAMVGLLSFSGRDFGPMRRREQQQLEHTAHEENVLPDAQQRSVWLAGLPVMVLVGIVVVFWRRIDAYQLLLTASLSAAFTAVTIATLSRALTLHEASKAFVSGIESMIPAIVVLVLAWSISGVCDAEHLDTAGYIISLVKESLRAEFLPAIAFLVSGAVAFSIGSSFTTMALLLPTFIPLAFSLFGHGAESADLLDQPAFLGTIGAVLSGAIFGDHCSPISDTTVLSSAAAGCDHLEHVVTQMPYAVVVAAVSLCCGYLPVGFGYSCWVALPLTVAATVVVLVLLGKKPAVHSST
ncbi:MAG: hypothetical protein KDA81_07425 [Planctomycetaceae bacterium]|nr:hypothetical protein [Planctomycetaceae bacterium]